MARRTKEQAQATRSHILDTADLVFEAHGVSGSSLQSIAKAAGLTRGAIYWHFENKADLFNAMMARATLPLEQEAGGLRDLKDAATGLAQIRAVFVAVLRHVVADVQMQRVFAIATHKVEYIAEMSAAHQRHLDIRNAFVDDVERALKRATKRGEIGRRIPAAAAAVGLHALLDGLLQNWMLAPGQFDLVRVGTQAIDAYLAGLAAG